ncbi:MAG: protein phosphatase 2C domain-containing protein, partial [Planctomycetes bacterium]|nr:protein phosphatase 2C domain-containing protein [Planctomycetota bacterium]
NPRDMWIPLEPEDGADLSWKHHRDARRLLADRQAGSSGWDLYGASIRGRAHAKEAKYREDDFALGRGNSSSPWHVLVSCDGAGSASLSRYGSALVAKSVASFLITRLEQPPPQLCVPDPSGPSEDGVDTNISAYPVSLHQLDSGFHHVFESPNLYDELAMRDLFRNLFRSAAWDAVDAIAKEAQRVARPEKDFNSTLLIVLFRQHPVSQKALVATFQIGDGAIGIGVPNDSKMNWKVFGTPDSGQFAGETIFLSRRVLENEDTLADRTRIAWFESAPIIFAMSDGVSDPRFPSEASLDEPDGWQTLWDNISPTLPIDWSERESDAWIEKLYAVLDRYDEGHHDDRTIVIARPTMSTKDAERHG